MYGNSQIKKTPFKANTHVTRSDESHWLTNFGPERLDAYQRAIAAYGKDTLSISNEAYDTYGHKIEGWYSLWVCGHEDLSKFWNFYYQIVGNK